MDKTELRRNCRRRLANTPPENFKVWGERVFNLIAKTDEWKNSRTVFCFMSLPDEIDTYPLIEAALQSKCLCVPKITENGMMNAVQIRTLSDLERGKFGILEPKSHCRIVAKKDIDLIIMPCLAADTDGHRLGKGGGYYDRFCETLECKKIAVCPEMLLSEDGNVPTEKWDVSADFVVTENRITGASLR